MTELPKIGQSVRLPVFFLILAWCAGCGMLSNQRYGSVSSIPESSGFRHDPQAAPSSAFTQHEGSSDPGAQTCFIATAAYGSPWEKNVVTLRCFRERFLLNNQPGRRFVEWYYLHSPAWAAAISRSEASKYLVRVALTPFVVVAGALLGHGHDQCLMAFTMTTFGLLVAALRRHAMQARLRPRG